MLSYHLGLTTVPENIFFRLMYRLSLFQVATQRCSLLLVDRTLDLFGPTTHQSDTLVDRILKTLFRPSHTSSDVCVDMSPVVGCEGVKGVARGSLAQPNDDRAQQLLKSLVHSRQKVRY